MKAIIPVAGFGSRMLPATKAIPKEMLPLVDKPLIQYIVEECVSAGISDIILVNHSSKRAIEDHFDTQFELEQNLETKGKADILKAVRETLPADANIITVKQPEAKGLGHAVLCAYPVVGDEAFAVVLPDVILDSSTFDSSDDNLAAMKERYDGGGYSQVMLERVSTDDVDKYGIADLGGIELSSGEHAVVQRFVEKPKVSEAPSNLAVVGRYIFSPNIWPELKKTTVGAGGEIQLTDAMDTLLTSSIVEGYLMKGTSFDCGNKLGYAQAFVTYALRHPSIGTELSSHIQDLLKKP